MSSSVTSTSGPARGGPRRRRRGGSVRRGLPQHRTHRWVAQVDEHGRPLPTNVGPSTAKELELAPTQQQAWLVKIPKFVAEIWEAAAPDAELGVLRIDEVGGQPKITVELKADSIQDLPRLFELPISVEEPPAPHLISEDPTGNEHMVEGIVRVRAEMQPMANDIEYRRLMKMRSEEAVKKHSYTKMLEDDTQADRGERLITKRLESGDTKTVTQMDTVKRRKETHIPDKNVRMDRDALLSMLFSTFEAHEFLTFKEINAIVKQPQSYLKEELSEICEYHSKGPQRTKYQLRAEYRRNRPPTGASSSTSSAMRE